ncbi:hypothetical protein WJX81_000285 [Elliptochloris bilobata]|uniref:Uncharacterized protein n=1 Tax=Elliptochloris bilobata TaxID=381761 RepID=A0AAW1RWF4_9CHLO
MHVLQPICCDPDSLGEDIRSSFSDLGGEIANIYDKAASGTADALQTTSKALDTVVHRAADVFDRANRHIQTAEHVLEGATNATSQTLVEFKDSALRSLDGTVHDVQNAAGKVRGSVDVASPGVSGAVSYSSEAPAPAPAAWVAASFAQKVSVDATDPFSLSEALEAAQPDFAAASDSILVATAHGAGGAVSEAVSFLLSNETSANATDDVPLGLAEAFAMAMLTAQNATVAGAGAANASGVADVFVAGLQDAALACTEAHRPAAPTHTEAWFAHFASTCCPTIAKPLRYMSIIMQSLSDQAVAKEFFDALGASYTLGSAPAFNLARCLGQDPSLAAFTSA